MTKLYHIINHKFIIEATVFN